VKTAEGEKDEAEPAVADEGSEPGACLQPAAFEKPYSERSADHQNHPHDQGVPQRWAVEEQRADPGENREMHGGIDGDDDGDEQDHPQHEFPLRTLISQR
jgi:hypothetical protein